MKNVVEEEPKLGVFPLDQKASVPSPTIDVLPAGVREEALNSAQVLARASSWSEDRV